jgi:hypothetical protein
MKYLFVILCLLFSNSWAAIGTVTENKGSGCDIVRGKEKLSGTKGAGVESMDTITNGACESKITFKDDTKVNITANSKLLIDDFVYDPKASDSGKLALKVAMGSVRYASGQIAKNNPQQVDIKTPTATIAVRGTDFNMVVDETGQSLVILLPSCKDEKDVKKFEMEENKCRVGKIEVTTMAGSVTLEEAFAGTYVFSANAAPTPPRIINTVEGNIGNHLLLAQPKEVKQAIREANGKEREDRQREQQDLDSAREQNPNKNLTSLQNAYMLNFGAGKGDGNCNSITNICITWERTDVSDIQSKGRGVAYRGSDLDHYAEVKTQGFTSNTTITVTQNWMPSTELIGDGSPGGNIVNITQNMGVRRTR